jgi:hypothetical protein
MPIEDRLRTSLQWDPATAPAADPEVLAAIVARAGRRRIRVFATTAAAGALLVAVAAPWAISRSQLHRVEPVRQPTQSARWVPPHPISSPLDEHWEGSSGTRAERLAALEGTGLKDYGPAIYAEYLANATTDVQFANGEVTLMTSALGGRSLGAHNDGTSLHGTFTARGHLVTMRFDKASGTTVFRWSRVEDGVGERLELNFISTTVDSLYGVPAEVFFRLWSARPFWLWGCC